MGITDFSLLFAFPIILFFLLISSYFFTTYYSSISSQHLLFFLVTLFYFFIYSISIHYILFFCLTYTILFSSLHHSIFTNNKINFQYIFELFLHLFPTTFFHSYYFVYRLILISSIFPIYYL